MYFRYLLLSPLWKGWSPSFEQTWFPFTQGCFVPSLVEIGPVVLEKKMKMWKVYRQKDRQTDRQTDGQTDGRTDAGRQLIRKAHLSFQLRWAKNWSICRTCICFSVTNEFAGDDGILLHKYGNLTMDFILINHLTNIHSDCQSAAI